MSDDEKMRWVMPPTDSKLDRLNPDEHLAVLKKMVDDTLDVVLGTQKVLMEDVLPRVRELEHHVETLEKTLQPELRRLAVVVKEWLTGRRDN